VQPGFKTAVKVGDGTYAFVGNQFPDMAVLSVWPACLSVLPCARLAPRRRCGS